MVKTMTGTICFQWVLFYSKAVQLSTGPGTGESVGNSNQQEHTPKKCFQKDGSGVYAENDWNLYAKENSTPSNRI